MASKALAGRLEEARAAVDRLLQLNPAVRISNLKEPWPLMVQFGLWPDEQNCESMLFGICLSDPNRKAARGFLGRADLVKASAGFFAKSALKVLGRETFLSFDNSNVAHFVAA